MSVSESAADSRRRQRRPRFGLVLLFMGLAAIAATWLWSASSVSQRECSTIIAYVTPPDDNGWRAINTYSDRTGVQTILRSKKMGDELLGYDEQSKRWVFTERDALALVLVDNKGSRVVNLNGLPERANIIYAKFHKGKVYLPCAEEGACVLHFFTLDGKPAGKRRLRVPGLRVGWLFGTIDIASNGLIAASLSKCDDIVDTDNLDGPFGHSYLFDRKGQVILKWDGVGAQFSPDGKSIAYITLTSKYDMIKSIVIMDIKTGEKKTLEVWPAKDLSAMERLQIECVGGYLWDCRNQMLFLRYAGGSCYWYRARAVDISTSRPKWRTLPIDVDCNWVLLDRMPKR